VWAVGSAQDPPNFHPIIEHFDGTNWTSVPTPRIKGKNYGLNSIYAISPTDVWAVGAQGPSNAPGIWLTLVEHWDGSSWSIVRPFDAGLYNFLRGVYGDSDRVLAVGNYGNSNSARLTLGAVAACNSGALR
jgi:hypothetical protein